MKVTVTRTRRWVVGAATLGLLAATAACGSSSGSGDEEKVTLKFTTQYGPGSFFADSQERWMKDVEELSGGTVEFRPFWSGSLVGAAEALQGVQQGRADLGFVAQPYFTAELPLSNASYLPQFDTDAAAIVQAYAELHETNELLQAEWADQNLVPLAWNPVVPMGLGSREPIESIDDFDGLTVRSSGSQSLGYEAMGAGTAAIASEETYEALQRGTVDAWAGLTIDGTASMGFPEVAPHLLAFPEFYSSIATPIAINKETFEELTQEQQDAMREASENYHEYSIEMAMEYEEKGCQQYLAAGGSVSQLDDDERERWMSEVEDDMSDAWYESTAESSLSREDLESFVTDLEAAVEKFSADSPYVDGFVACLEAQDGSS